MNDIPRTQDWCHITDWVFDLDNTLYPAKCNLFKQIDSRMTDYVGKLLELPFQEARRIQKDYYVRYGTTLSGLMKEHDVAPHDFMDYVHDIDLTAISANVPLATQLENLPGRCFVFTNGSVRHARNITSKLGIEHVFDGMFDIDAAEFVPKPNRKTYERFLSTYEIDPQNAAMFEDIAVNLEAPNELGMKTVLVCSDSEWFSDEPADKRPAALTNDASYLHAHIHHRTDDLTGFLSSLMTSA